MNHRPLRIVVAGMIAADPNQGGATWAVLQYLLGFRRLGHQVTFVEPIATAKLAPAGSPLGQTANACYLSDVLAQFGLENDYALLGEDGEVVGMSRASLRSRLRRADLLVNISGLLRDEELLGLVHRRLYLDLDPAFNQLWSEVDGIDMGFDLHTDFATVGLELGSADCAIPTCGHSWTTTLQPVVLEQWKPSDRVKHDAFTTIANWRAYGSIHHDGVMYGQKAHSLRPLFELPSLCRADFLLALGIHPEERDDLDALRSNGWRLVDPIAAAGTPDLYRDFVRGSYAELGVAKSGYVVSKSGWFSDRSACYLASGRPVLAQRTGFERHLPIGSGLLSFSDIHEAVEGVEEIRSDYSRHAQRARRIAEEYFDSDRVLSALIDRLELQ